MRQITRDMIKAFMERRTWQRDNTCVDGDRIYLHGNLIAERRESGLWITLAGWPTRTTRDRLNALPGGNVYQKGRRSFITPAVWTYPGDRPGTDLGVEMTERGWYLIGRDSLYCYVPGPSGVRWPDLAPGTPTGADAGVM